MRCSCCGNYVETGPCRHCAMSARCGHGTLLRCSCGRGEQCLRCIPGDADPPRETTAILEAPEILARIWGAKPEEA